MDAPRTACLTFALVPGGQRRPVRHGGGAEVGGGAVHLVGEGAVGQALLLVPLADEARQGELVVGGEAGGVAEALRPRGAVLLDGTGLEEVRRWTLEPHAELELREKRPLDHRYSSRSHQPTANLINLLGTLRNTNNTINV